jgi:hypothetical protein
MHKPFFSLLFVVFLSVSNATTQNPVYTIQIGTFTNTHLNDFDGIYSLGFIYADDLGRGMYRLFMGGFSNESSANNILQALQQRGFSDARVIELDIARGEDVLMLQLATRGRVIPPDWEEFEEFEPLYVLLENDLVKLLIGPFSDRAFAQKQITYLQENGFPDAFPKYVNSSLLHPIGSFHRGEEPSSTPRAATSGRTGSAPDGVAIPDSYETDIRPTRASAGARLELDLGGTSIPEPVIRGDVKRASVVELQKVLKAVGLYTSSIDGLYGNGTRSAYEQASKGNSQVLKYRVLGQALPGDPMREPSALQHAIDELAENPASSLEVLRASNHPMANIYLAYYLFETQGSSQEVNERMNASIRRAFEGRANPSLLQFDPNASYAYNNREQLLLHMRYVHQVSPDMYVPCWLFRRHIAQTIQVFQSDYGTSSNDPRIQNCMDLFDWQELLALQALVQDMGSAQLPAEQLAGLQERKIRLLLAPSRLPAATIQNLEAWSVEVHAGVQTWGAQDPMLRQLSDAFGLLFYQSQILLEDYYMTKSVDSGQVRGLALATLQTILGLHLERFL